MSAPGASGRVHCCSGFASWGVVPLNSHVVSAPAVPGRPSPRPAGPETYSDSPWRRKTRGWQDTLSSIRCRFCRGTASTGVSRPRSRARDCVAPEAEYAPGAMQPSNVPLWLADTWVDAVSSREGPTGQVKKLFEFAEGLLELMSVGFLATAVARQAPLDAQARMRLANAAVHAFGKRTTFGDWARIVEAGLRGGAEMRLVVIGRSDEPLFAQGSAVARCFEYLSGDQLDRVPLTRFNAALAHERNDFTHHCTDRDFNAVLSPLLRDALEAIIDELPALRLRPLCHVEQAAVERPGEFVVRYRHLLGNARIPDQRKEFLGADHEQSWHSGLLAFWDGQSRTPTPVPRWLASFDAEEYVLRLCQGTDRERDAVLYHARQPRIEARSSTESYAELWAALIGLGATAAPSAMPAAVGPSTDSIFTEAFHRALVNDGRLTSDEVDLLDGLAHGLGLDSDRRRELEAEVRSRLGPEFAARSATPIARPMASVTPAVDVAAVAAPALPARRPRRSAPAAVPRAARSRRGKAVPGLARRWAPAAILLAALAGAGFTWGVFGRGASVPEICYAASECADALNCEGGKCVQFPRGPGGDAARSYMLFSTLRNEHNLDGYRELIDDPIECWFYSANYDREKFIKKRFPSEGSTSLHVVKELIIVSESSLRVTLQDRGRVGNHCHDTTVLMVNRGGTWRFSGEGSQRKVSEEDTSTKRDCWVELGGPAAEARFGRYCPPVK